MIAMYPLPDPGQVMFLLVVGGVTVAVLTGAIAVVTFLALRSKGD